MHRIFAFLIAMLCVAPAAAQQQEESSGLARYEGGGFTDRRFGGTTELSLDLSQGVPWRLFTVADPLRLVIDFREVDWEGATPGGLDASRRIGAVRVGSFRPGWSRMVADLAEPLSVDTASLTVSKDGGSAQLTVILSPTDAASFAAKAGVPRDPGWDQLRPKARRPAPQAPGAPLIIVLDPGHGGIDPGAERAGVKEADLVLQFGRELRDVLLRSGNYDVRLTRNSDVFVSLEGRVAAAHDAGADVFISLHADALEGGGAKGAAVYTLAEDASDAASAALAERHDRDDLLSGIDLSGSDDRVAQVLLDLARQDNTPRSQALAKNLVAGIRNNDGKVHKDPLRQAAFSVLKSADIPSVLVELGFLSSQQDLMNLQDPAWRAGMAAGIRDGLAQWLIEDKALSRLRRQ
ncbi:N-acetylmuramoyl-L-alanine amidase [Sagittula stellata]|uniref:N-acetylmuramoyl-L-alanine amidase n=1 Tax=Sagittula stellata (strain ATCC 700073 / DSM 11524 / E-37) TaxID=388399 RepID=A3K296_SAGS3|nr:N-acetylmuramoyl-L-alanine amidase [Sagittula stellata]EBA09042.1 N-acetylmuramoyl-L-alanine amidase, family 3 [Sagittula stellata E-37]